jgi:phage tail-like protein
VRGTVEELATPHPLGHLLPALYHDNDIAQRFTAALDIVLAPVLATLDSSHAYVDPLLAPLDFVEWLAEWVGVELDASWPEARQRALVARAADLFAWRGTVRGVSEAVAIYTGVVPEVVESGATAWTGAPPPSGELPGFAAGEMVVRVRVAPGDAEMIDPVRLDRLVAAAKPAHIAHRVEVFELAPAAPAPRRRSAPRRPAQAAPEAPPEVEAAPPAPAPDEPAQGDLDGDWPDGDGDEG